MDLSESDYQIPEWIIKYKLPLIIGGLGVALIIFGLVTSFSSPSDEIVFEPAQSALGETTEAKKEFTVDISGAVVSPGVYSLTGESRIHDGLIKAGGLNESADRDWVAKNLNLATKLQDGMKIYIPEIGEKMVSVSSMGSSSIVGESGININSASSSQLESLPGIGPVTAGKILDGRPYATIDDLVLKKIISAKVFERIKDKITAF